jgi:hypothetical protein
MDEMQYVLAGHTVTIRPPPTASLCANQSKGRHEGFPPPAHVEMDVRRGVSCRVENGR